MAGQVAVPFATRLEGDRRDIWRYVSFYGPFVEPRFWLTLGEGWTPALEAPDLARELSLDRLVFKREDLNPTGSHKARALAYQVSKVSQEGKKALLIPSSGNAAVAAAAYTALARIRLFAFISPRTNPLKLREMVRMGAVVISTDRPINMAKRASQRFGIENLRPSVNDASIEGFKSISFEIRESVGDVDAVFTFVSSGSSLLGIARAYETLVEMGEARRPKLFAVHAGALSDDTEGLLVEGRSSTLAGTLGVKKTRRARAVLEAVTMSDGEAMLTSDSEIEEAAALLAKHGILTSPEGVASFAALKEIATRGGMESAVCVLTGHSSQWPDGCESGIAVTDERELDDLIERTLAEGDRR